MESLFIIKDTVHHNLWHNPLAVSHSISLLLLLLSQRPVSHNIIFSHSNRDILVVLLMEQHEAMINCCGWWLVAGSIIKIYSAQGLFVYTRDSVWSSELNEWIGEISWLTDSSVYCDKLIVYSSFARLFSPLPFTLSKQRIQSDLFSEEVNTSAQESPCKMNGILNDRGN